MPSELAILSVAGALVTVAGSLSITTPNSPAAARSLEASVRNRV
jgi:hypothetical protein